MTRFMQSWPLALTPLTPIHVGCGEDFEPTNYVILDGALFHFDPGVVPFTAEDRRRLVAAVAAKGDLAIRQVQRFFFERREMLAAASQGIVAVAGGVATQYENRIGEVAQLERGGHARVNVLEIERTAHHPHNSRAYIPGSSLKGAIRTAWLDRLNDCRPRAAEERAKDLEGRLLKGTFDSDPFRMVKLADTSGNALVTEVFFSTNHKKRPSVDRNGQVRPARGLATRREAIVQAQYRALVTELRLEGLGGVAPPDMKPDAALRISSIVDLAAACNRFYRKRLASDLDLLGSRGLVSDEWLGQLQDMLRNIEPRLDAGQAMLLRVGRHGGAESVTLDGVRSIRVSRGPGRPAENAAKESTTVWLAADREDAHSGMQPFGWLLVEVAGTPESAELRAWCDAQPKPDLSTAHERVRTGRERLRVENEQQQRIEARKREEEERRQRAEAERQERLAALSLEGREVEALRGQLESHTGRAQPVSGVLYAQVKKLINLAHAGSWSEADRHYLADVISDLGFQKIDFGGRTSEIKRELRRLRGEA